MWKLNKAICGLKQAPCQWLAKLQGTLDQYGFTPNKCDHSHQWQTTTITLLVYVDDKIIIGNSFTFVQRIINQLTYAFSLKSLSHLDYFFGIEIRKLKDGYLPLTQ